MQWNKVKSILIVLLLAVNLFLCANILLRYFSEEEGRAEIRRNVVTVLERQGITCGDDVLLRKNVRPIPFETERQRSKESAFARALLGGTITEKEYEDGSSVFRSRRDQITWKANGSVEGTLTLEQEDFPKNEKEAAEYVRFIMNKSGLECSAGMISTVKNGGNYENEISYKIDGISVFNCVLKVILKSDETIELAGRWNFGELYEISVENQRVYPEEDVLLTFVKQVPGITHIDRASLTYYMADGTGGKTQFIPAWRIVTDDGEFCVDAMKKTILEEPKTVKKT